MKTILYFFGALLFGMFSCKFAARDQVPLKCKMPELSELNVGEGSVMRFKDFQSKYVKSRNVDIWLPNDYSDEIEHSVIYMHDGQMLFDSLITWNRQEWGVDETLQSLIDEGRVAPTIVVGIWNVGEQRHNNYFPMKAIQYYEGDTTLLLTHGFNADNYLCFIINELMPCVASNFNVKGGRETTFVAGSSMGGLISMYAVCEYPNVFGGAAGLSTHWPGISPDSGEKMPQAILKYLEEKIPSCQDHRLYFDYGNLTLDSFYLAHANRVSTILSNNHCDDQHGMNVFFEGHDHSERSWKSRLHIPFKFLLTANY